MAGILIVLLLIAVIFGLGFAVKALFWLFIVALILFVVTGIFGWVRRRT